MTPSQEPFSQGSSRMEPSRSRTPGWPDSFARAAANIPEFGSVKDKAQFEAMYAYSPYHRVKDGTKYPPALLLTGDNDPRVDPMQSRKMAARLQAATSSGRPILLRSESRAGHGQGKPISKRIDDVTDYMAFAMHQTGLLSAGGN